MDKQMQRAAQNGDVYAMLALAYIYHHGLEGEYQPELAIDWYKKSAARGCARAKWELAKMYRDGMLVQPNSYEFIHWLTAAADDGIPEAMMDLALRYYHGILVPKDIYMFTELLLKAGEQNYVRANFYLWYLYSHGIVFDKDEDLANKYKEKLLAQCDADYIFIVGKTLEFGKDPIVASPDDAIPWYTKASEMGSDKAIYSLGRVDAMRKTGRQDTLEQRTARINRLSSSAEAIQRDRVLDEADMKLEAGENDEAVSLYIKAAELGNAEAMFMLAFIYHGGEIVKRNDNLAFDYLTRSAMNGNTEAQMLLASHYENGTGVPKDINEAIKYYAMAAAAGNLVGYYELNRFMEHPELYVRRTQRIVR